MDTENKNCDLVIDIDNYRKIVKNYMNLHLYSAALFWADKVVALSNEDPKDVYWMAQCMYLLKQYHRSAHLIRNKGLDKSHILCHYVAVRSLFEARELTEALQLLEAIDLEQCINNSKLNESQCPNATFEESSKNQIQSAVLLLKGRVYEAMDNRGMASDCYKQALHSDIYCFEAFDSLVQHQMLSSQEEQELLSSLPIAQQCTPSEAQVLNLLYESKLRKYHAPCVQHENESLPFTTAFTTQNKSRNIETNMTTRHLMLMDTSLPGLNMIHKNMKIQNRYNMKKSHTTQQPLSVIERLHNSLDMAVSLAEKYYYNCQYTSCIRVTENVLKSDPFHSSCLPVHIACLVDLKESNKLFYLAHRLVILYPELSISWFSVGCYYYVIGKSDPARRYLSKATALDRLFGPAWLAYGHSFAVENEHDQAMAAYFKASQLMKGCHLPLLYIGLECGLTHNERLAEKFFQQAKTIAPNDPFVMHEMGVIAFQNLDYKTAEKHFREALSQIHTVNGAMLAETWEPLLNNLGHTCRKRKKYLDAMDFHKQALNVSPQNAATYSALGYVQALLGRTQDAIESFHKALGLRKNDTFSITMLRLVVDELLEETSAFVGAPHHRVPFDLPPSKNSSLDRTLENSCVMSDQADGDSRPNGNSVSDMSMSFD